MRLHCFGTLEEDMIVRIVIFKAIISALCKTYNMYIKWQTNQFQFFIIINNDSSCLLNFQLM